MFIECRLNLEFHILACRVVRVDIVYSEFIAHRSLSTKKALRKIGRYLLEFSQLQEVTIKGETPADADFIAIGLKAVKTRLGDGFQVIGGSPDLDLDASDEGTDSDEGAHSDEERSSDGVDKSEEGVEQNKKERKERTVKIAKERARKKWGRKAKKAERPPRIELMSELTTYLVVHDEPNTFEIAQGMTTTPSP